MTNSNLKDSLAIEYEAFFKVLREKYSELIDKEITDWAIIKELIGHFINKNYSNCIVDFIDTANWDSVESISFDDENRTAMFTWHDFTSLPDNDDAFLTISTFGGHKIGCDVTIDSLIISSYKKCPMLLIKSRYSEEKEINKKYNTKCSDYKIQSERLFSVDLGRIVKKKIERITIPNVNCFTMLMFPKYLGLHITSYDSKYLLFKKSLSYSEEKILDALQKTIAIDDSDYEGLKDIGNRIRRNFENILKVLNLNKEVRFGKDYQKLMLGDLVGVVDNSKLPINPMTLSLNDLVTILNICSHDSGKNVSKKDLLKVVATIMLIRVTNDIRTFNDI